MSDSSANIAASNQSTVTFTCKEKFIASHFVEENGRVKCIIDSCKHDYSCWKSNPLEYHLVASHIKNPSVGPELQRWQSITKQKLSTREAMSNESVLPSKRRLEDEAEPEKSGVKKKLITNHFKAADEAPGLLRESSEAQALCFAMLNIPLAWAESPYFNQMLRSFGECYKRGLCKKADGKTKIAQQQQLLAEQIDVDVHDQLVRSTHPGTFCHDG